LRRKVDECKPLYHGTYLTGGTWSPTRPGVFFTIKMDGELDVWDYYYKQNDPTLSVKVTDKALTAFNIQDTGRLVTVGAADGSATLMVGPSEFCRWQPPKSFFLHFPRRTPQISTTSPA
jgi:hypothetical protein